jgi:predicted nucleotidyltransferase
MTNRIAVSSDELKPVCERWKFQRLWLFGSALREDFHSESDVDLLVEFAHDADWGLLDHVAMEEELSELFGRPVDLVTRRAIERSKNTIRRDAILTSAELLYVAG